MSGCDETQRAWLHLPPCRYFSLHLAASHFTWLPLVPLLPLTVFGCFALHLVASRAKLPPCTLQWSMKVWLAASRPVRLPAELVLATQLIDWKLQGALWLYRSIADYMCARRE